MSISTKKNLKYVKCTAILSDAAKINIENDDKPEKKLELQLLCARDDQL